MKKTGSIRVEIKGENAVHYWIDHPNLFRGYKVFGIPKYAVTEIRTEVDWSKVKKGTIVLWEIWEGSGTGAWFFAGVYDQYCIKLNTTYEGAIQTRYVRLASKKDCTLLEDWLKEQGGRG